MANEWTVVELYGPNNNGQIVRYGIASDQSVSKGALLQLLDDRIASGGILGASAIIAGVASEEHIAGEGITDIGCWTDGRFRAVASGSVTVGDTLVAGSVKGNANENTVAASGAYSVFWPGMRVEETNTNGNRVTVRLSI